MSETIRITESPHAREETRPTAFGAGRQSGAMLRGWRLTGYSRAAGTRGDKRGRAAGWQGGGHMLVRSAGNEATESRGSWGGGREGGSQGEKRGLTSKTIRG